MTPDGPGVDGETWGAVLHDLPDAMYSTPRMSRIFSGTNRLACMLRFEAALAAAEARAGLVPAGAAEAITRSCDAASFDITVLAQEGSEAGTIAAPVIAALRDAVPEEARGYVHLGSTSQDVIDTAAVLQMREGVDVLIDDLVGAGEACAALCRRHRETPMVGRTLLQQAVPVTFGLKAAGWLGGLTRQARRLRDVRERDLVLQFGGAAGTLASLGTDGLRVTGLLAEELGLPAPPLPWHAERSRVVDTVSAVAVTTGAMTKIAADVVLLMQTEVAEVAESGGPGKGTSSAMPHKRNPVDTMAVLAAGRLVSAQTATFLGGMASEHERAVGAWQAEWAAIPAVFRWAGSAVARTRSTLENLRVDAARMRANLRGGGGQSMAESLATALGARIGKHEADRLVASVCERAKRDGRDVADVATEDDEVGALLSPGEVAAALDPLNYLGSAPAFVDRALADFAALQQELAEAGSTGG